ncbi:MAG: VWA domain-containing protein [Acidobacteria bacterium]|nr:VWA domain-containing protein [Acidobacteriota bacterium]
MTRPILVVGALIAVVTSLSGQQRPAFRGGVDIVSLSVTATELGGRYVTDLGQDDFQLFEDGVKQDLVFFSRSNLPIALSLLIDTSASMEEKLATAQEAASRFVHSLRPQDVASIIDFDSRVEVVQPFTSTVADLEKAIRATAAGGSTALHNAVYISLKELKKMQGRAAGADEVRRQAIVVLSDGEDTSSLVGFDEVLELAKRSETSIYAIGLKSRDFGSGRGFKEAEYVLRTLSQETGGRFFYPNRIEDLNGVYEQIREELSSQYLVGYASKNGRRDGAWRRIVVRLSRPNVTARTKLGYYAPAG